MFEWKPKPKLTQFCTQCGNALHPDAKFCTQCGKEIIRIPICPQCNLTNDIKAVYCKECGSLLRNAND